MSMTQKTSNHRPYHWLGAAAADERSFNNPMTPLSDAIEGSDTFDVLTDSETTASGVKVTRKTAMAYSAVWKAVNLKSNAMAKLPINVYKRLGPGERGIDRKHDAQRFLRKPCSYMTRFNWIKTLAAHRILHGNGYAAMIRSRRGRLIDSVILDPEVTCPIKVNGALWYVTSVGNDPYNMLPARDVFHLKGLGYDGMVGYSTLSFAAESVGVGLGTRRYAAVFFKNSARPSVTIEVPGVMSDPAWERLKGSYEKFHQGLTNQHRAWILEEGAKVNPFSINAEDAQLIETRQFELIEISNFFEVPPHKLGSEAKVSYNSLESENQAFLDDSLDPDLINFEEECNAKLLTEQESSEDTHYCEFNRNAFARADMKSRFEGYNKALQSGWMNRDEVRARENMDPMPDGLGKKFTANGSTIDLADVDSLGDPAPHAEDDTVENVRSVDTQIIAAHRELVFDAARRMSKRMAIAVRKAAKKPDSFDEWAESVGSTHGRAFRGCMEPVVRAVAALMGANAEKMLAETQARFFDGVSKALAASANPMRGDLAAIVDVSMDDYTEFEPRRIVDCIFDMGGSHGDGTQNN